MIKMVKHSLSIYLSTFVVAISANASVPTGYYDALEGKSGVSLKTAVKKAARSHAVIPYGTSTWEVFLESDTRVVGGQRCWWDMYSNDNVAAPNATTHPGMNIEHSVANSWWGKTQNDAYKDLVHLNPSNSDANSRKGNYALGEIGTLTWNNGVTYVGKPKSGLGIQTSSGGEKATYVYEPADEYKGDFARAFFYMFTIYDDISWTSTWDWMYDTSSDLLLRPWAYEMLLRWAKEDPVSQKEIDRNEAIYRHQKNRNPFIDCPELAEHIWGSKKNTPFHFDGSTDPGTDPDDPGKDPGKDPGVEPTPVPTGYWYAVTGQSDMNETDKYVLVSVQNHMVMSTTLGSSGKFFQDCGNPVFDSSVAPARLSSLPTGAAILTFTKSGAGWNVKVSTADGVSKGYLQSTQNKELTLTSSPSANGTTVNITVSEENTRFAYNYSGSTSYIYYNNSAPRFTTYNSNGQEPVMLYRLEEEKNEGPETGIGTGTPETAEEVVYGIYDIYGRKVAAEGIYGLDKGIYIVISNFGTKKIMKK